MTTVSSSLNQAFHRVAAKIRKNFPQQKADSLIKKVDDYKKYIQDSIEPLSKVATLATYLLNGYLLDNEEADIKLSTVYQALALVSAPTSQRDRTKYNAELVKHFNDIFEPAVPKDVLSIDTTTYAESLSYMKVEIHTSFKNAKQFAFPARVIRFLRKVGGLTLYEARSLVWQKKEDRLDYVNALLAGVPGQLQLLKESIEEGQKQFSLFPLRGEYAQFAPFGPRTWKSKVPGVPWEYLFPRKSKSWTPARMFRTDGVRIAFPFKRSTDNATAAPDSPSSQGHDEDDQQNTKKRNAPDTEDTPASTLTQVRPVTQALGTLSTPMQASSSDPSPSPLAINDPLVNQSAPVAQSSHGTPPIDTADAALHECDEPRKKLKINHLMIRSAPTIAPAAANEIIRLPPPIILSLNAPERVVAQSGKKRKDNETARTENNVSAAPANGPPLPLQSLPSTEDHEDDDDIAPAPPRPMIDIKKERKGLFQLKDIMPADNVPFEAFDPGRRRIYQGHLGTAMRLGTWRTKIGISPKAQNALTKRLPEGGSPGTLTVADIADYYSNLNARVTAWPDIWPVMMKRFWRKQSFARLSNRHRTINAIAKDVFGKNNTKVAFWGDARFPSSAKGNPPAPTSSLRDQLAKRGRIVLVDEFRTSMLSFCCHSKTKTPNIRTRNLPRLTAKARKADERRRWAGKHCTQCKLLMNRDLSAARNIAFLAREHLAGRPRPAAFSRSRYL